MKKCQNNCKGWRASSKYYFGLNGVGTFALLNVGFMPDPKEPTRCSRGSSGYSNAVVTHCPWCGSQLAEDKPESALDNIVEKYPDDLVWKEIKERLEALESQECLAIAFKEVKE